MMNGSKNNIKFSYLYRDSGNYKQYGDAIFSNYSNLDIVEVSRLIKKNLIDGEFFEPLKWSIPLIYEDKYDPNIDHEWYEFVSIEPTDEETTDVREIKEFLSQISEKQK